MASLTLALSGGVQLVAAASFLYVGRVLYGRARGGGRRSAALAFVAWWWCLAAYMVLQGTLSILASAGVAPLAPFTAARFVSVALLSVAGWGLAYYVLYLYTGRAAVAPVMAGYYALVGAAFLWAVASSRPERVVAHAWQYAIEPAPELGLVYVFFGAPPILATLGYLSLLPRIRAPMQRYRVGLVSGAILAWVASGLAAQLAAGDFWKFFTVTILGLVTAVTVLLAYRPPGAVVRRLDPGSEDALNAERRSDAKRAQMSARISELV